MKKEIEKKYLYSRIPVNELEFIQHTVVYRKYLSTNPEVRISCRVFDDGKERYHLNVKNALKWERDEVKVALTEEEYEDLSKIVDAESIIMDVYDFRLDNNHIIGFKKIRNMQVEFAEIEFQSNDDYINLKEYINKIDFLYRDVTYIDEYYMRNIWNEFLKQIHY